MSGVKPQDAKTVHLLGLDFTNIGMEDLLDACMERIRNDEMATVVFLNVDVVVKTDKDDLLREMITNAEYVVADGMPIVWLSKFFHRPLVEKVSGSDFVPRLCERAATEGRSVYIVGGKEHVLASACRRLREQHPGLRVDGASPPWGFEKNSEQLEALNQTVRDASPDILVACLGCPKQEKFVYQNRDRYRATLSICAGATVDFLAGTVKRCPAWMSRSGLEWFYRFLQEPKRLFRRYFIDDLQILRLAMKHWRESR